MKDSIRVLICGGRDYSDRAFMHRILGTLQEGTPKIREVIHGAAKGADSLAGEWAKQHGIPSLEYPADWQKHGRAAGPIRNELMLREGKPDLVIAFHGGRGTAHMCRIAKEAGVEVWQAEEILEG